MTEFELKFEIPPARLKTVATAVLEGKATRQRLQASYFDTADGALAAHGIVVRLRKEGRRWVQTAKGPTADLLARLEQNVILPQPSAGAVPALDLARHYGTPVGKAIDQALGRKADGHYPELMLLYSTDVQRMTRLVACGNSIVEVALDQGRVFADGRTQSICELELELKDGIPLDAVALARQWRARHGLWMSTIAKSMKGQRLRSQSPFGDAVSAAPPSYSRHAPAHDMLTAVVLACLSQILPNMSELAGGSDHPDHIHQMRVGIRRLRTALRELADFTDAIDPQWEPALVNAFRVVGRHRDQSNLALVLQPQLVAAGGPHIDFDLSDSNLADAGDTVRAPDFQDVLLGLLGFAYREPTKASESADKPDSLKKTLSLYLDKLHKRVLRDGKKFLALSEEQQHGVRKRLKRLRYLMEFAAPLFAARKVNHMVEALKPVQDALGLYNDELMALDAWRKLAAGDANAWFGVGWLTARRQPNAKRCLKEIKAFAIITPFWRG